jgi:hypothetical protein
MCGPPRCLYWHHKKKTCFAFRAKEGSEWGVGSGVDVDVSLLSLALALLAVIVNIIPSNRKLVKYDQGNNQNNLPESAPYPVGRRPGRSLS